MKEFDSQLRDRRAGAALGMGWGAVLLLMVLPVAADSGIPPSITAEPCGAQVRPGDTAVLKIGAIGSEPLAFQWFFNGNLLAGATNSVLILADLVEDQSGTYSVRVRNDYGSVRSYGGIISFRTGKGGAVFFVNFGDGNVYPVFDVDGVTPLEGARYLAQLYSGPSVEELAPVGAAVPFWPRSGGIFEGDVRYISTVEARAIAPVQIRAWDSDYGPTYEQALAAGGRIGESLVLRVQTGGNLPNGFPTLPTDLVGLQSFSLHWPPASGDVEPAGLDPVTPRLLPGSRGSNRFTLKLNGLAGARYRIEVSKDLVEWELLTEAANDLGIVYIEDRLELGPQRFYRAHEVD